MASRGGKEDDLRLVLWRKYRCDDRNIGQVAASRSGGVGHQYVAFSQRLRMQLELIFDCKAHGTEMDWDIGCISSRIVYPEVF